MHLKESEASGKISGLEKKIQYAEIEKVCFDFFKYILFDKWVERSFANECSDIVINYFYAAEKYGGETFEIDCGIQQYKKGNWFYWTSTC